MKHYIFEKNNFAIIDKGRTTDERSLILIEDGHYRGFGYFDEYTQLNSKEDFQNVIKQSNYYPDADDLVKGFLKQNLTIKKVVF